MEGSFRPQAPTQKSTQKTVRFCNYCQKNGNTPKWYRKKNRDEEIRRMRHDMSFNKNSAPKRENGTRTPNVEPSTIKT